MLQRLLPCVAVVLLGLGSAGCADDVAPAARIGDRKVSHDDLLSEVEEWAGNDATQASQALPVPGTPAGFATDPIANILGERILLEILAEEFERRELELPPDAHEQALILIGIDATQEDQLLGGFSDEFRAEYLERWEKAAAVQVAVGEEIRTLIAEGAEDVEVDPRYGTWDAAAFAVVPPEGPRPAPGDGLSLDL